VPVPSSKDSLSSSVGETGPPIRPDVPVVGATPNKRLSENQIPPEGARPPRQAGTFAACGRLAGDTGPADQHPEAPVSQLRLSETAVGHSRRTGKEEKTARNFWTRPEGRRALQPRTQRKSTQVGGWRSRSAFPGTRARERCSPAASACAGPHPRRNMYCPILGGGTSTWPRRTRP